MKAESQAARGGRPLARATEARTARTEGGLPWPRINQSSEQPSTSAIATIVVVVGDGDDPSSSAETWP